MLQNQKNGRVLLLFSVKSSLSWVLTDGIRRVRACVLPIDDFTVVDARSAMARMRVTTRSTAPLPV